MSHDWSIFAARRPDPALLHLDTAAAGRQSTATLEVTAAHARLEAVTGAYVAAEQRSAALVATRADVATLLGMVPQGVAFVEGATAGLRALLDAWPLPPDARVGIVAAEWGPNCELLAYRGIELVLLDADPAGRVDVDSLTRRLRAERLDAVHLTHVASHRGLVQPAAAAAQACRDAGVPLWVDSAQAIGHVECAVGADALYATSRKWLAGPRGVGVLAVRADRWSDLSVLRAAMAGSADTPAMAFLESHEAHVAGRIGLGNAVRELLDAGPADVYARLIEVGNATADALRDVAGWAVVGEPAGAITAVRPLAGQDVDTARRRLLTEHRILTTAGQPARAPLDMSEPLLRISPHVDCTAVDLARLATALASVN